MRDWPSRQMGNTLELPVATDVRISEVSGMTLFIDTRHGLRHDESRYRARLAKDRALGRYVVLAGPIRHPAHHRARLRTMVVRGVPVLQVVLGVVAGPSAAPNGPDRRQRSEPHPLARPGGRRGVPRGGVP